MKGMKERLNKPRTYLQNSEKNPKNFRIEEGG
jgi:hypothetical protein